MPSFLTAFAASLVAAAATSAGIYSIRRFTTWARRHSVYCVAFAAGLLLAASFLHLVPHSFSVSPHAPAFLLGGFLGLHLFNRTVTAHVCEHAREPHLAVGITALLAIALHSFIDGIIYSTTFRVSVWTGALAATGMVLHEFPEGIVTYLLLIRSGFSDRSALLLSLLAAALTTPLGTVVSYPMVSRLSPQGLAALLALSAGALIYLGASHLLPEIEHDRARYALVALAGGVLVAAIVTATEL